MEEQHLVLGASGSIGLGILDELARHGKSVVGAARSPREGWKQVDLVDSESVSNACAGASHIYLCAGLPYRLAVWQEQWPRIMDNVITAAESSNAKIIFVDNIYMYGSPPLKNPVTEEHPQNPSSQKGKVRKSVAAKLLKAHSDGKVRAVIARAPDFYGPTTNGLPYVMMLDNMLKGKPSTWVGDPSLQHTFGHVGDISKSMVTLALDESAYGEVWHTPTSHEPMSAKRMHQMLAEELGASTKLSSIPGFMVGFLKLIVTPLREFEEMGYQYYSDYVVSSEKFEKKYPDFKITTYNEGVKQMVQFFAERG